MEIIYQHVYQRSEILIRKQVEIDEEFKKLDETKRRITLELERWYFSGRSMVNNIEDRNNSR